MLYGDRFQWLAMVQLPYVLVNVHSATAPCVDYSEYAMKVSVVCAFFPGT